MPEYQLTERDGFAIMFQYWKHGFKIGDGAWIYNMRFSYYLQVTNILIGNYFYEVYLN